MCLLQVGTKVVLLIGDGVAHIHGLHDNQTGETIEFGGGLACHFLSEEYTCFADGRMTQKCIR